MIWHTIVDMAEAMDFRQQSASKSLFLLEMLEEEEEEECKPS